MDDLVLCGAAGILGLFLAAVILLFGIYSIAGLMYAAFLSGSYDVLFIITGHHFDCRILVYCNRIMAA